jgi:hypothetical protein
LNDLFGREPPLGNNPSPEHRPELNRRMRSEVMPAGCHA